MTDGLRLRALSNFDVAQKKRPSFKKKASRLFWSSEERQDGHTASSDNPFRPHILGVPRPHAFVMYSQCIFKDRFRSSFDAFIDKVNTTSDTGAKCFFTCFREK